MSAILNVSAILKSYRFPPDFRGAFERLFLDNVNRVHSRTRISAKPLSIKTQEYRMRKLCRSFEELRENGYALQSPYSLKGKHIQALVDLWVKDGQSGGTIENKLTYFRALAEWMGKSGLVGALSDYADRKALGLVRSYVALRDKSWEANGVDAVAKIEEIALTNLNVAMQLKLQATFGLRVEESFMLRPTEAIRDAAFLAVVHGTKGGRAREVPLESKFAILEEAARVTNPYTGSMMPHGRTMAQWRNHYYYVLQCHGVTEDGLGITSHGLRHQYLQQLYERLTTIPAPIKGALERVDRETHRAAIQRVVEAAGHSRATKSNAYLSTYRAVSELRTASITPQQVAAALDVAAGNKSQAAKALGISRQALYRYLARSELSAGQ